MEMTPSANFAAHNHLVDQLQLFLGLIADDHLLTQDPDLASFYLIDTAVHKLPRALERLGRLRAYCLTVLVAHTSDTDRRFELRVMLAELDSAFELIRRNLTRAAEFNVDLATPLKGGLERLEAATRRLADLVHADLLTGDLSSPPPPSSSVRRPRRSTAATPSCGSCSYRRPRGSSRRASRTQRPRRGRAPPPPCPRCCS